MLTEKPYHTPTPLSVHLSPSLCISFSPPSPTAPQLAVTSL